MKERFIYVIERERKKSETLNLCSKLWGKKKKKNTYVLVHRVGQLSIVVQHKPATLPSLKSFKKLNN